jgi:hypothetical protein
MNTTRDEETQIVWSACSPDKTADSERWYVRIWYDDDGSAWCWWASWGLYCQAEGSIERGDWSDDDDGYEGRLRAEAVAERWIDMMRELGRAA